MAKIAVPIKRGTTPKSKVKKLSKDIAKAHKNGKSNGLKVKKPKSGSVVAHVPPPLGSVKQPSFSNSYITKYLKDYK